MSEDFDREAEREKLRQQLEAEEEDRRATQRMSDLLLKGATMTNKHCNQCGDPIFRHQNREFCSTCQREVGADEAGDEAEAAAEPAAPDANSDAPADDESGTPAAADRGAERRSEGAPTAPTGGRDETAGAPTPADAAGSSPAGTTSANGVGAARDALARTLVRLAREAEATDDVGRTRDLLTATREAAEALAAVDAVGR